MIFQLFFKHTYFGTMLNVINSEVIKYYVKYYSLFLQEDLEKECPDILKLGLLHEVGKKKATVRKQPAYLSYEHKSLQEFGASKFVTERLETSENMKVRYDWKIILCAHYKYCLTSQFIS